MKNTITKIATGILSCYIMLQACQAGTIGIYAGRTNARSITYTTAGVTSSAADVASFYVLDYDANMQPLAVAKYDVNLKTKKYAKDTTFALNSMSKRGFFAVGLATTGQTTAASPIVAKLDKSKTIITSLGISPVSTHSATTASAIVKTVSGAAILNRGIYKPATNGTPTFAAAETALTTYLRNRGYTAGSL